VGSLDGQVAVVTGCGRMKGLGRGIATALAAEGADLAVTDLRPGGVRNTVESDDPEAAAGWRGLESLVEELEGLGRRAIPVLGDVGMKDDVERMVEEVLDHYGRIDILVNNAAAPHGEDRNWTWEVPEDAWDLVMRVNAKGVFLMNAAVVRHMLDRGGPGRIVNIASTCGRMGFVKRTPYCASKFAVVGMTQVLAKEVAEYGITVNTICPGAMNTARWSSTRLKIEAGADPGQVPVPLGRMGEPADIGAAVAFLAGPSGSFVTGQALSVNGGQYMFA